MNVDDALQTAARLEQMGIAIKSPELLARAQVVSQFNERQGNRAMRRAAARAGKRKRQ